MTAACTECGAGSEVLAHLVARADGELEDAVRAALARVIAVAHRSLHGLADATIVVPKSEPELDPILLGIPQLLANLAVGRDVDQPRNLAKSVTVEQEDSNPAARVVLVDNVQSGRYLARTMSLRSDLWLRYAPAPAGHASFGRVERIMLGSTNAPRG